MAGNKKSYDLVCSLGGNCAAAHNLKWKGLRLYAYPFDWTYVTEVKSIYKLAESFKNNFSDILLRENLKELPANPDHKNNIQYEDKKTNIVWPNHFKYKIENDKEYQKVKQKIDRRCKRLLEHINKADKILFLFSLNFEVEIKIFVDFLTFLSNLYPNKKIDLKILCFNCKTNEKLKQGNLELLKYQRAMKDSDFNKTNQDWSFLDDIILSMSIKQKTIYFLKRIWAKFSKEGVFL